MRTTNILILDRQDYDDLIAFADGRIAERMNLIAIAERHGGFTIAKHRNGETGVNFSMADIEKAASRVLDGNEKSVTP